ncbi:MAG: bifunctional folylpolyglutamate synthase/dihydrofolate synthase [Prevotella sp.]|jgi:dihydrofolate synthase/folylpolyglutamate synthase
MTTSASSDELIEETYQRTTEYLFNSTPVFEHIGGAAYKDGLDNTKALDEHFGHPHEAYLTLHVAGTNGKGSCSHSLAAILQKAGYKVGLYTSPHLVDFRERIRVNGVPISKERVIEFVRREKAFFEPLHPSFFELTTALAFLYFKEQKVDVAVVEVGLGGRLDCTNIIRPLLSIITNISFDHTQFLGNTLDKIAAEKAGIIKEGIPVVIGETVPETRPVFEAKATDVHAPIYFAEDQPEVKSATPCPSGGINYDTLHWGKLHGELSGQYQLKNMNTLLVAVDVLRQQGKLKISDEAVREGVAHVSETGLTGRWQTLRRQPLVICDTGHNLGGWQYLAPQIKSVKCRQLHIVFGMVDDKDINHVMTLLPKNAKYYWTQATSKRAIPKEKVAKLGTEHGLSGESYSSVVEAYHAAIDHASPEDFIFVGGSSYIVADLLMLKDF